MGGREERAKSGRKRRNGRRRRAAKAKPVAAVVVLATEAARGTAGDIVRVRTPARDHGGRRVADLARRVRGARLREKGSEGRPRAQWTAMPGLSHDPSS